MTNHDGNETVPSSLNELVCCGHIDDLDAIAAAGLEEVDGADDSMEIRAEGMFSEHKTHCLLRRGNRRFYMTKLERDFGTLGTEH